MAFLDEKYLLGSELAFALFNAVEKLPVVDPHNHADVTEIAKNKKYSDPWQVFAATDHYVWEMLRKRNVEERYITGDATAKEKWMKLGEVFPDIAGNPVYEWVHLDLQRYLGIKTLLAPDTAEEVWEQAKAVLSVNTKRPQSLLKEMNVEVMCSTDDPSDLLGDHETVNKEMGRTVLRPTWRPDKYLNLKSPVWKDFITKIGKRFDKKIVTVEALVEALEASHDYFASKGCVASDHGITRPVSGEATKEDAEVGFKKALEGKPVTQAEADAFTSYMLVKCAKMNAEKDWVFQLHMGAVRDVRDFLFKTIGPDAGGDVSDHMIDIVTPVGRFLNKFDDKLKVVLYCLDAGHQASLATLARAFGSKVRLGSAWWLNDTPIGMKRQLEYIGSVDLLSNFAGMVSDSRKILSYGSRFEMFRRVLSDVLGTMVVRGQIPYKLAERLAERVCYSGPKEFFNI